jgi:PEP-CTERM motif
MNIQGLFPRAAKFAVLPAAALLAASSGSEASTVFSNVSLYDTTYTAVIADPALGNPNVYISPEIATVDGKTLLIFCDDLSHLQVTDKNEPVSVGSVSSAFNLDGTPLTAQEVGALGGIYSIALSDLKNNVPNLNENLDAAQGAAWHVLGLSYPQVNAAFDTLETDIYTAGEAKPVFGNIDQYKPLIPDQGMFGAAVPEPGTWAMMLLGFGAVGAMARHNRRKAMAAAALKAAAGQPSV